ncbi:MAG: patatin-like phospholipase family protein [Roseiarcus sp.]
MSFAFFRKVEVDRATGGAGRTRKRIGVALGAGVARGWAHIGALQELEAIGVRPEVIVGVSIGAVVGGCYAAGKLGELETFARSLTRRGVFGFIDLSFNGGGLIGGDRLRRRLERDLGDTRIEDLPLRFAGVATEIGAGHEIWLKSGPLVEAMRASYALPGVFEPVRIGGRWLFDGAIVNPVPVSVARALGAERVIALAIGTEGSGRGATLAEPVALLPEPREPETPDRTMLRSIHGAARWMRRAWAVDERQPPGMATVMANTFNIAQDRIMRSRLAGDPPDYLLTLKTGRFGIFEFHRAAELIDFGRAAVRRASAEILEHLEIEAAR